MWHWKYIFVYFLRVLCTCKLKTRKIRNEKPPRVSVFFWFFFRRLPRLLLAPQVVKHERKSLEFGIPSPSSVGVHLRRKSALLAAPFALLPCSFFVMKTAAVWWCGGGVVVGASTLMG